MNEREFYRMVLGLQKPWEVKAVEVDAAAQKVEVTLGKGGKRWEKEVGKGKGVRRQILTGVPRL